jgi:hypothetical protein
MRQRGGKSVANLMTLRVDGEPARLQPPRGLSKAEQHQFNDLINATSPKHFAESDLPLLVTYVQATVMARSAIRDPKKIAVWEKATRVQAVLATKLRLAPQSRSDAKTTARQTPPIRSGPPPWEL